MVDGDDEVGIDVVVAAGANAGGIVSGCANVDVSLDGRQGEESEGKDVPSPPDFDMWTLAKLAEAAERATKMAAVEKRMLKEKNKDKKKLTSK